MKSLTIAIAVAAGAATTLAACGSGRSEPAGGLEAAASKAPHASTEQSAAESETPATVEQPSCEPEAFLPVVGRALDNEVRKLRIVDVRVQRCQTGYAQVFAVPAQSVCQPGVGYCYETEQVFLGWKEDTWRVLFSGTGITCEEPGFETVEEVALVCKKLGYAGY
jgi:hypothetical protein